MQMSKILGIIAGEGKYPVLTAKGATEEGWQVVVACVKSNANESDFKPYSKTTTTLKIGQLTKCIEFFKQNGVTHVIMAGRVKHINIFSRCCLEKIFSFENFKGLKFQIKILVLCFKTLKLLSLKVSKFWLISKKLLNF